MPGLGAGKPSSVMFCVLFLVAVATVSECRLVWDVFLGPRPSTAESSTSSDRPRHSKFAPRTAQPRPEQGGVLNTAKRSAAQPWRSQKTSSRASMSLTYSRPAGSVARPPCSLHAVLLGRLSDWPADWMQIRLSAL